MPFPSVEKRNMLMVDEQGLRDLEMLILDARRAIQDAYSVACVADRLKELDDDPESALSIYCELLRECADDVMSVLDKYAFDFRPENPFDGVEGEHGGVRFTIDGL